MVATIMLASALAVISPIAQKPVTIAIIDTGVAMIDELRPFLVEEHDMASPNNPRRAYTPRSEHGTNVASILVRNAPVPIRIISFRVDVPGKCKSLENCQIDGKAVDAAVRRASGMGVDIVNMSLDMPASPMRKASIQYAARAVGIRFVIAAGNQGGHPQAEDIAIAAGQNCWLVGATNGQGRPLEISARPRRDLAPGYQFVWENGENVPAQTIRGDWTTRTGTSMAAPLWTAKLASKVAQEIGNSLAGS